MYDAQEVWEEARVLGISKWEKGQKEHGGTLARKPVMHEAIAEVLDLVSYLFVLRRQVSLAKARLADALANNDMASVESAFNLLHFGNEEGERNV